uniref:Uncharacterized protein n=1 Tax=Avena sativa TaxID=4498 RepID=A0ACD5X3U9_AVESA
MSSPPPTTTSSAPPPAPSVVATTAGSPLAATSAGSAAPAPVLYTPEQMSGVINDLVTAVQGIRLFLIGSQGPPTLPQPAAVPVPALAPWAPPFSGVSLPPPPASAQPWTQWPPSAPTSPGVAATGGVPIHQIRFPPSPSPLPAWLAAPSTQPVYTNAGEPPVPSLPSAAPGGYARPHEARPDAHGPDGVTQPPPRYTKVDFATYDGSEDPLNCLSQCEQFFRGQRTLASDRTWLASYHLRGAAQTWYYALEQDEGGMPPWDRFRELCLLRFGPPIRGSRLAELGRLPFTSTVQDFADRFQALACHAPGVTGQQCAELFVGGLPDHIRVDVELQASHDLQTAMHYARAADHTASTAAPAAMQRTFRRLTPAEQLERRRLGLCFNCDEPYAPGHVCPRLFYLETVDDGDADTGVDIATETALDAAPATACVVSLHALAGIRNEQTMLLPVMIHGEQLVALLDTGSTHNFLPEATMWRLGLQPTGGDHLRVTVANGDRLRYHGVAQHVPLSIGDEPFTIACADIDLGYFDFILGVDFLRPLGPILWDFAALTMTFWCQGRRVCWTGIGGAAPAPQLQLTMADIDSEHPLLAHLLQQHGDLFDEPQGLPPTRVYDHCIHLASDTAPVAVRPYRYPQL